MDDLAQGGVGDTEGALDDRERGGVVLAQHDAASRGQKMSEKGIEGFNARLIELGAGLVEKQDGRVHDQHGGQEELVLLAHGQRADGTVQGRFGGVESDARHGLQHAHGHLGRWHEQVFQAEGQLGADVRTEELRVGVLQDEPDATGQGFGHGLVAEQHLAAGTWGVQPGHGPQQRRLAAAGGAGDAETFSGADLEVDPGVERPGDAGRTDVVQSEVHQKK
ncbi:hypothetical protein DSECCO2_616210 [anaerobic digester metagenome]